MNIFRDIEKIKSANLARWQSLARACKRHCVTCGAPLDEPVEPPGGYSYHHPRTTLVDCCDACLEFESILYRRAYWTDLKNHDERRRKDMGLEGAA